MPFDLSAVDPAAQLIDLDRADTEESLYTFYKAAWSQIDSSPWMDGWCMDAIAEHLQAVCDGQIKRLIINISPRCSKSSLVSVAFPAWVWAQPHDGPISGPAVKFLHASYANQLSLRDSVKCRRLIESNWYQKYWGHRFQLVTDQNTKSRFANDRGGERLITSIEGTGTGEGGMCVVIDDPNSVDDVDSEATIQAAIDWWDGVMPTRINSQEHGAFIIIQQRTFENDLTGHILETQREDYVHLMIPMRFEPDRACITPIWSDPRTVEGQLMWPERFSEKAVARLEKQLGKWRSSGQLQQRPSPKGGGIIERAWWQLWEHEAFPPMDFVLATLDTAFTEDQLNDPSGMIVWGVFSETTMTANHILDPDGRRMYMDRTINESAPKAMMMHAWDDHLKLHDLVKRVAQTCIRFKVDLLLIENKASGISVSQEIRRLISAERFGVQLFDPKSQDKVARLISIQHLFEEGLVYAPSENYPWVDRVITQVENFPKAKHDEYVDLTSMGLRHLRNNGLISRAQERLAELEGLKVFRGNQDQPLYPV